LTTGPLLRAPRERGRPALGPLTTALTGALHAGTVEI
jgi:hypothetical protein